MMRISWGPTLTAGVIASLAIVVFMAIIPQLLGLGVVDLTRDLGAAFSTQSPYMAGIIALVILGTIYTIVFGAVSNSLPGTYLTKGAVYGLIVGLFSLAVLPSIITTVAGVIGSSGQYNSVELALNTQAIVTLVAYMVFGVTLALSYRPTETSGNV